MNNLLANPFSLNSQNVLRPTLGLNQIENFEPVREFTDDSNVTWQLVKDASNATVEIPNPKAIQITDYWNHAFPGINTKLYVYVVEGIKQPRIETERPTRVLYQWFSTVFIQAFTPQMITDREWLKANVYAAPMLNSRVSKLNAICHIKQDSQSFGTPEVIAGDDKLIQVDELDAGHLPKYHGEGGAGN